MREKWRKVHGYKGLYQVSNLGRVQSLPRITIDCLGRSHSFPGVILRPGLGVNGCYLSVVLYCDGERKTHYVHDLVAAAFIGRKPRGFDVCHGPNGSQDNHVCNLHYGTRQENHLEKYRDGTMRTRTVRQLGGRTFPSLKIAAIATGLNPLGTGIHNAITGYRGACTAGGYEWEYVK